MSSTSSSSQNGGVSKVVDKTGLEIQPKPFLQMAIRCFFLTVLWLPVYIYRCMVVTFVKKYRPSHGRILDHRDSTEEESYWEKVPCNSLVFTLVLDGSLQLQELRELFTKNVLQAKLSNKKTGKDELRYPELKQYQTHFGGYTFWKNDESFNLAQHISEQPFSGNFASMSRLHQEMTNKKFPRSKSPWEVTLVQNYQNDPDKTLLILRCHHTLGDVISFIKLIVEGLGQKSLRMPDALYLNNSFLDKIRYYALLPIYFVYVHLLTKLTTARCDELPWIQDWDKGKDSKQNVSISKNIPLADIKTIAKKNNVTTSAVIMAAVVGGVARSDKRLTSSAMPILWILPKLNHPDILANHLHSRVMDLPTNVSSPHERLQICNEISMELKSSKLHEYGSASIFQHGTWFSPFRFRFSLPGYTPLIITNIASDREGFQVGSAPCSELIFTSGAARAIVSPFSYKDSMRVTTTVKDSILSERQTHELTELIEKEFAVLKNI